MIKLLEETIRKTFFVINHSKFFSDQLCMEEKLKNQKLKIWQIIKHFLHSKENHK